MGSDKRNGNNDRSRRGSSDPRRRRAESPWLESLEDRRLLAGPAWTATSTDPYDVQNGPLAPLGATLINVFHDLNTQLADTKVAASYTPPKKFTDQIYFSGSSVGVSARGTGDFAAFQKALTGLGMRITATAPTSNLVEGFIPVSALPRLAVTPQLIGAEPNYRAVKYAYPFQGVANNESADSLQVPLNVQPGVVNGTGQRIGVLSDTADRVVSGPNGERGLAASVATGDLPNNVQVLLDGPTEEDGGSDEGRAMLEQIYDIAPGAQLGFATADGGQAAFATNIQLLANAGFTTIVDDIGYPTEPFFQDGPIAQSVNSVTAQGATYLAAAGNAGDGGYLSQFRGVNATVGALGAGRYMNFDPTGATTTTQLGVYAPPSGAALQLYMQFDQAFGRATSNVAFYLLDRNGAVAYRGETNTAASGNPVNVLLDDSGNSSIAPDTYTLVIKVISGPDPTNVVVYNPGNSDVAFDKRFGSAGGTYYPTTKGHNAGANTISVGAVPFWAAPPYLNNGRINNESFSAFGPVLSVFNPDGSPKTPQLLLKPDVSSAQGNNTSFFIPNYFLDTTNPGNEIYPVYPGNTPTTSPRPATPTNQSQPAFPNFTGTSSAAPNLAAVVALMKQVNPGITRVQIVNNLTSTATPLNGAPKGVWNPQGGYGLANAALAVAASNVLQVNSVTPGSATTITQTPTSLVVNFSKPVNLGSLNSNSITVVGANGATVAVGQPIGLDSTTYATQVLFPIAISPAAGRVANGTYTVTVNSAFIRAQDNTGLASNFTTTFNLQDAAAPRVVATSVNGRIITVTFSEAINPASITQGSVYLFRAPTPSSGLFDPGNVIVSNLPGAAVTYNPATLTATINLSGLPQTSLPTGHYGIGVMAAVTDLVGNPLNGQFSGVFPSGTNPQPALGANFIQDLGVLAVPTPTITSLVLAPYSDSGVAGDSTTNVATPSFIGQIGATFPSTNAGLQVYVQFNGIAHPGVLAGGLNLNIGTGGRGTVGIFDAVATTDANGRFTINYPAGVTPLPEGQNQIRAVVVGQPDLPGQAGLASAFTTTFQIDRTLPYVGTLNGTSPTSILENATINSLSTLTISVVDPVNPTSRVSPFAVNAQTQINALNPSAANNLANYSLYLISSTGVFTDLSSFLRDATFTSTSNRVLTSDPFTGTVTLTFAPGLPQGKYALFVRGITTGSTAGVTDSAGNPITNSAANSAAGAALPYILDFFLQPTATYITGYGAYSADAQGDPYGTITQPRANYEIPLAGTTPGAPAPPIAFTLDFSNSLAAGDYSNKVILARSADPGSTFADGDFGNFGTLAGLQAPTGYTQVSGISVTLGNSILGAQPGQPGYNSRLTIRVPAGSTLPADYYRIYAPNVRVNATPAGDLTITDIYGSQLDGEFLGYQNAAGKYVNQLNDGSLRGSGAFDAPDLTGDGLAGGAFVTGFVVVPNGNVIYARPDAIYNPQLPSTYPDGTANRPYPVLAPEATYTQLNAGDLNSVVNSGVNFNPIYDRAGLGTFQPSAFFAAQEKARLTRAPVVIIAQAALATRDPITGVISTRPFVLQAPAGSDPVINDASAAIPAMTTLVFQQGSVLKMLNSALLVQNQGSALQIQGGPNPGQLVTVTSYKDSSVGGATNGDASQGPTSGDYGGILFRNFNQAGTGGAGRSTLFPGQIPITGAFGSDGRLKGPFTDPTSRTSQLDAVSGADPVMSFVNFLVEKYAGGNVPQTFGTGYDGITMQNSRPTIVNTTIALAGVGSAQSGLSVDIDSLRKDDVASGALLRNLTLTGNNLNGIYVRAQVASGVAEPTTATNLNNAAQTYIFDDPYPYLFTSRFVVGNRLQVETSGAQGNSSDRLFISPGMLLKFSRGSGIQVNGNGTINVGDTTYINQYLADNNVNPSSPNFKANSALLANVLFTSLYDDVATTTYTDPLSGATRPVVAPLLASVNGSGSAQPTTSNVPSTSRWGGVSIASGAVGVFNSTIFRYGGGEINTGAGTGTEHVLEVGGNAGTGARISVTNNTFDNNVDVPINLQPDSLKAGDPTRPLLTGDPFIRGNTFVRNTYNAVGVQGGTPGPSHPANLNFNSTWDGSDFTYLLRDTIVVGPNQGTQLPIEYTNGGAPRPNVTLTLQSTLPGTVLADGTVVASPGIPLVIKTLNNGNSPVPVETPGVNPGPNFPAYWSGGAGFIVGVDNGIDPPTFPESYIDNGIESQIRILGIPGNQSTKQTRVPVIITSARDTTVGTTSNGVTTSQIITGDATAAAAGDGGVIFFGANSLPNYNFQDLRSGSVIDNADIRYMTRIEQQGGGYLYQTDVDGDNAFSAQNDSPFAQKYGNTGVAQGLGQYNTPKKLTISNSNLASFSDGGVVANPGFNALAIALNYQIPDTFYVRSIVGVPTETYIVNSTISNMTQGRGTGLQVISATGDDAPNNGVGTSPSIAIVLNSTFYNNTTGISAVGQAANGNNPYSAASILAMDSIFDSQGTAITGSGQVYSSQSQYNLFHNNTVDVDPNSGFAVAGSVTGDPAFRDPANGNFNLRSNSAAIDKGRSELGPSIFGDVLYPAATYYTAADTNLNKAPVRNQIGNLTPSGGYLPPQTFRNTAIVTLPGEPISERGFPDQWYPTLVTAPTGTTVSGNLNTDTTPGTAGNGYTGPSVYTYRPLVGERDYLGNLRVPNPGTTPGGFGSRPYFDLGAFEYIVQVPPVVTSVNAISATTGAPANLYVPSSVVGTNQYPAQIRVGFSERLDPATITAASVQLVGSGGDGSFGEANDVIYNLANRLSFDVNGNFLVINTAGLFGATTTAANDLFRLTLKGSGSSVLRDTDGLALDGDTANNTAALPSGVDDFPGSDFSVRFTIDTNPPSLVAGTFGLAAGSYRFATNTVAPASIGLPLVNTSRPTFVGKITDIFPPATPLQGAQVFVDISTSGDPNNFNILGAATGTTDATGNFSVTANQDIPNTAWTVGPDARQGSLDDTGGTLARVRIVDQSGNTSLLVTDPYTDYLAARALISLQVDTQAPQVTALTPASGTQVTPNANGTVTVTATFSKNIDPTTLTANSVLAFRAGGTGVFTNGGIAVPLVANSFNVSYLGGGKGPVTVTFNLAGPLPNDFYRVVLKGTGANPVRDVAGNALDGLGTGVAGSGDYTSSPVSVFSPANSRLIYVDGTNAPTNATATQGSRTNPFATIAAGINAAQTGDVILVLPGTYREQITLKAQTRLLSADSASTDAGYYPGNPLATIIYGNTSTTNTNFNTTTGGIVVNAQNIGTVTGVPTEISGFTILAPLVGDVNRGSIDTTAVGVSLTNANVLVDKNYIVNAGVGVRVTTSGANVFGPQILTNVIAGNFAGIGLSDSGSTTSYAMPTQIINNTIVDNTYGMYNESTRPGVTQALVFNDIFYNNHALSTARTGTGILSQAANTLIVGTNLFYGNGVSGAPSSNASGVFTGFNPAFLTSRADTYGNFTADPAFVAARDPRPNGDTPATFFVYGNYDLSSRSAAINGALQAVAPATDILYRVPVQFGKGQNGTGPASIGAFYFAGLGALPYTPGNGGLGSNPDNPDDGTGASSGVNTGVNSGFGAVRAASLAKTVAGGTAVVGGSLPIGTLAFNVVRTSLDVDGSATNAAGVFPVISAPTSIDVDFSNYVDRSSVTADDLRITGSGLDSSDPAHATGLSWVDGHTVRFLLSGKFNSTGSIKVAIPDGAVKSLKGDSIAAFAESFQLGSDPSDATAATPALATAAQASAITVSLPVQPVAVAGPVAVHYNTKKHKVAKTNSAKAQASATAKAKKAREAAKVAAHAHAVKPAAKHAAAKHVAAKHVATKHGKATK